VSPKTPEEITLTVTSYLRGVRITKGVSQNQLSQLSGISRTGLGHIESGSVPPSFANVLRIAKALEVSVEDVMKAIGEGGD